MQAAGKETRNGHRIEAKGLRGPLAGSISRGLLEVLGNFHPWGSSRVVWAGGDGVFFLLCSPFSTPAAKAVDGYVKPQIRQVVPE